MRGWGEPRTGWGVASRGLPRADGTHAVVEQHHVVLDHAEPPRLRVAARAGGILLSLERSSLRDVGARAVETGFLVVPEREADRALRAHIGTVQHARQLHDQRRA